MMPRFITLIVLISLLSVSIAFAQSKHRTVNIIFDSDMGPDYDDVGAITILHNLADKGEVHILATMASTRYEGVAGVFSVFNTYFKRPALLIGVPKGQALDLRDWQHWTDTLLARYPHAIKTNSEAEDAVTLYRKILAVQADSSVTIVTVGFLTNLSNLFNTKADAYSSLDGRALVAKKVKRLVCMAGKFPEGYEFNVMKDAPASQHVLADWPTPVIFSGFEIGEKIFAGIPFIRNQSIQNSPTKDAFRIAIPLAKEDSAGRKSWDETAVLVAIRGYGRYYTLHTGHIKVTADGKNTWNDNGNGQAYLIEKMPVIEMQKLIDELIQYQPK